MRVDVESHKARSCSLPPLSMRGDFFPSYATAPPRSLILWRQHVDYA